MVLRRKNSISVKLFNIIKVYIYSGGIKKKKLFDIIRIYRYHHSLEFNK